MVTLGVEWVQDFPPSGCVQNNLDTCPQAHGEGFGDAMRTMGHNWVFEWGDDNAWATDFEAPAFGGDSVDWSDNVNFCWFSDHGLDNGTGLCFANSGHGCFAMFNEMQLGTKNLKWAVFDCCDTVLGTDPNSVGSTWFGPTQGIHMLMAFVGTMNFGSWIGNYGSSFGFDVGSGSTMANAWLNDAANWWAGNTAIAIAMGDSQDQAQNRLVWEAVDQLSWDVPSTSWLAWSWWN